MASGTGERQTGASTRAGTPPTGLSEIFGLSAEEGSLVEELCAETLAAQGLGGERLLERLRDAQPLGAALGLTPEVLEAVYARAHRWFAIGLPDRAEPLFRALCAADASCADYWVGFGICLRLSGQMDASRMAFETAMRLRPDWCVPTFHLSELLIARGEMEAASRTLALFRSLANEDTPPRMRTEAARFERAVDLRRRG